MSQYSPLQKYLASLTVDQVRMSYSDLCAIVELPASAYHIRQWWGNQKSGNRPQRDAWRGAEFKVETVKLGDGVTFTRCRW